ncbi:putative Retrotransposon protein [Hibiscus syriacus]|uniref:Putative Retrotransposon protein n=1 Tax=Hibiscus syriacus TaxID=106335 RepID=A0A6A2Z546_HIBSY|nr:putative Retrotransposon protein [Hibiscus syriacus]KAE8686569.1 putative Retrotransposon protein [Hibiscus syriacus]
MGGCFSKKKASSSSHNNPQPQPKAVPISSAIAPVAAETTLKVGAEPKIHQLTEEEQVVKASQEKSLVKKESAENEPVSSVSTEEGVCNINTVAVGTSSCTKEEVEAILIQCGRLSTSNSSCKTPSRKYSGSKRSFDFDRENDNDIGAATSTDYGDRPRRQPSSRSSYQGRRRTPSREREQQQCSGSRERCSSKGSGGGRRVSRSPGRRSDNTEGTQGSNAANGTNRPGKMVSVPPTVSSLAIDKSINCVEAATTTANGVKRISVKRNVGESPARTAASPRSQSPAKTEPENQQQPALSRTSSRKAEHSPYRRNPLSEIDPDSLAYPLSAANKGQGGIKVPANVNLQKSNVKGMVKEPAMVEDSKTQPTQSLTRSRSSRRSRDLDLNPETLLNPIPSSYASLLLEDIQNFHQNNSNPPQLSLPAISAVGQKMKETGDPQVIGNDHSTEPSFHKYVTVRRGGGGADMEDEESSGSNSIVGSGQQQHWGFSGSSSWEPSSADSMDGWTKGRQEDYSALLRHSKGMR